MEEAHPRELWATCDIRRCGEYPLYRARYLRQDPLCDRTLPRGRLTLCTLCYCVVFLTDATDRVDADSPLWTLRPPPRAYHAITPHESRDTIARIMDPLDHPRSRCLSLGHPSEYCPLILMVISWSRDAWFDRGIWSVGRHTQTAEVTKSLPNHREGFF
jgi:hypothetical protein